MPNFSITITAETVAWYAAIVATLSVVFSFIQLHRDRVSVKVKTSEGFFLPTDTVMGNGIKIFVEAINVGRRPATLRSCALNFKNGKSLLLPNPINISFPYELQEGKSVSVCFDKKEVLEHMLEENTSVIAAVYQDATGKRYSKSLKLKSSNKDS